MHDTVDPTQPSRIEMSRKAFVTLSTAVVASAAAQPAIAATSDSSLGRAHAPLVPEDDPAIATERPTLDRPGGAIDAYAAYPRDADAAIPGVVVVQHIWGVDTQIRDVVRRFAKAGYIAIAPDLYSRMKAPSGDGLTDYTVMSPFAAKLVDAQADGDIAAGATWIRARARVGPDARPPKIGVTGFCMGGSITIRASVDSPQFDAAAVWYGKIRQATSADGPATAISLAYGDKVLMPLLGSFGGRDASIPADDVRAIQPRLKVPNDLKIYDEAGHAFFDDQRERYVDSAAQDAWKRTLSWFGRYLR
jgi:carboxymethylenebutenolidase